MAIATATAGSSSTSEEGSGIGCGRVAAAVLGNPLPDVIAGDGAGGAYTSGGISAADPKPPIDTQTIAAARRTRRMRRA
jgi:hypothetical protein